jgi:arginine decarboxylase
VGAAGEESTIRLHALDGSEYLIGVFLVGAYQESLGDLHNLFGDTHTVHVSVTASGYQIDEVVEGETVAEVLRQMQFSPDQLMAKVRRKVDQAVAAGRFSLEESRAIIGMFAKGLRSYTYLDRESLRS